MVLVSERNLAMRPENETHELERLAKAFQIISKETTYQGLAKALLGEALCFNFMLDCRKVFKYPQPRKRVGALSDER